MGGVAQTWDNNGNLLSDGVYTYTYDSANRLATVKQGTTLTYTFGYDGLGDRLRQTIKGITTTYALNLNAGLTQVLADGTNTYLYGNGRIAQYAGTTPSYFLGDALGSVRQLANASGAVTLARSYEPFGSTLSSVGSGTTVFQFTGEQRDATGLTYLRARYLSTQVGRFITRDAWTGDRQRPMSFNAWLYAYADPINLTDPSGHDPWWCDTVPNPSLCYANWIIGQGGKVDASLLRAVYQTDPNNALEVVRRQFSIQLPPGYQFRFSSEIYGFGALPNHHTFGFNPWFLYELRAGSVGSAIAENHSMVGLFFCMSPEELERTARYIDPYVWIFEVTFTRYNFNPDDIAGVMIHEGTHAWQESVAIEQQGPAVVSLEWQKIHNSGMERQAIAVTTLADSTHRIHLSGLARTDMENYRQQNLSGEDSPFILPGGEP